MNKLRTVVFIDGQNFKKNLQEFCFNAGHGNRDYRLDEKHFNWDSFFKGVLNKFNIELGIEHRLLRIYWYNAESISPFKENTKLTTDIFNTYRTKYSSLTEAIVKKLTKDWWEKERDYFNKAKEEVFDKIQKETNFLEFKYIGQYVIKPFTVYKFDQNYDGSFFYQGVRQGEKGVDIGISIDMVAKMNFYDVAVLLSGDADFQPLVRYIKDHLKQVYQFSIAKGVPPHINYLSAYLKSMVDVFQYFDEEELLGQYLKRDAIPHTLHAVIDKRIAELRTLKSPIN